MILLDYSSVAIPALFALGKNYSPDMFRHMIMNSIRMHNVAFRKKYGVMVVCADGPGNWRREFFPEYKQRRRDARKEDLRCDWDEIFGIIGDLFNGIKNNTDIPAIKVSGAEGDDVVASLCLKFPSQPHIIIASDHDFFQLHTNPNIKQYSPSTKKLVKCPLKDPREYLFEQIIKGCKGDGVPNIFSEDGFLLLEPPQKSKPITKKLLKLFKDSPEKLKAEPYFERNYKCICFDAIPDFIKSTVNDELEQQMKKSGKDLFSFLFKSKLSRLMTSIEDFKIDKTEHAKSPLEAFIS